MIYNTINKHLKLMTCLLLFTFCYSCSGGGGSNSNGNNNIVNNPSGNDDTNESSPPLTISTPKTILHEYNWGSIPTHLDSEPGLTNKPLPREVITLANGMVVYYDGSKWNVLKNFTPNNPITQISVNWQDGKTNPQIIVTFKNQSNVEYYNGNQWETLPTLSSTAQSTALSVNWQQGIPHIVNGLSNGAIYYYNGSKWANLKTSNSNNFITQISVNWQDGKTNPQIIVTFKNQSNVEYYNGNQWETLPTLSSTAQSTALSVNWQQEIPHIVNGLSNGAIYYYDGSKWNILKNSTENNPVTQISVNWPSEKTNPQIIITLLNQAQVHYYDGSQWYKLYADTTDIQIWPTNLAMNWQHKAAIISLSNGMIYYISASKPSKPKEIPLTQSVFRSGVAFLNVINWTNTYPDLIVGAVDGSITYLPNKILPETPTTNFELTNYNNTLNTLSHITPQVKCYLSQMDALHVLSIDGSLTNLVGVYHTYNNTESKFISYIATTNKGICAGWQPTAIIGDNLTMPALFYKNNKYYIIGEHYTPGVAETYVYINQYNSLADLLKNKYYFQLHLKPQQLNSLNGASYYQTMGTPSIDDVDENGNIYIRLHYLTSIPIFNDKPAFGYVPVSPGTQGELLNYPWYGFYDYNTEKSIVAAGGIGKIGSRSLFSMNSSKYYLYEAQINDESNSESDNRWASWRIFLLSTQTNQTMATMLPLKFDGSQSFVNPDLIQVGNSYILSMFVPSQQPNGYQPQQVGEMAMVFTP